MSDPSAPPQKSISITITLQTDGKVEVNGPLNNKILFLGLLESAKCSAYEFWETQSTTPRLATPPTGLGGMLRRMNGG